jgi:hypothetical protein
VTYRNFRFHFALAPSLAHLSDFFTSKHLLVVVIMLVHLVHGRDGPLRNLVRLLLERILQRFYAFFFIHVLSVLFDLLNIILLVEALRVLLIAKR